MNQKYILARDRFKPRIEYLLIAESPPKSGGYFYFDKMVKNDHLFRETMKALGIFPEDQTMRRNIDKTPLLKEFQSRDFFVVDVSYRPIDTLSTDERNSVVKSELPRLIDEVRKLDPRRIIIVKKTIYKAVKEALEGAHLGGRILNKESMPFPSNGHQKEYRDMLRELIEDRSLDDSS